MNVFYGRNLVRTMSYWETYPEANAIMKEHLANIFNKQAPIGAEMANAAARIRALMK
ncbi:MAG: hypothetical protein GX162_09910 [Firmicutes bacterium]|jgi:hypothetical protein|nr:hypothetical protein [Bacillota bacterium]